MAKSRSIPYEGVTAGHKALQEIHKILQGFGCSKFGNMMDDAKGELIVQFEYKGMPVSIRASTHGYAAAWLKAHPYKYSRRISKVDHERRARELAGRAVYSIVRDWIKGQITAIEIGVMPFESAFLAQIMLPNGQTVAEAARERNLLPAPADEKIVNIQRGAS